VGAGTTAGPAADPAVDASADAEAIAADPSDSDDPLRPFRVTHPLSSMVPVWAARKA